MNIVIYLQHPNLPLPHMTDKDINYFKNLIPNCNIINCLTEEELKSNLPQAHVLIIWHLDNSWLELAPKLIWLATPAAGRDYFSLPPDKKYKLTYGSFHGELISETILAMMLSFYRGIYPALSLYPNKYWAREEITHTMRSIRNTHATIVGFGAIGKHIGKVLKTFNIAITGVNRTNFTKPEYFTSNDQIISLDKLADVLPQTDHLILALPGGQDTNNIISTPQIAKLPKHSYIYNIGRGNSLDENALVKAINNLQISGAALDVYNLEPLPESSLLRKCKNIILLPHVSAMSTNYLSLFIREFVILYKQELLAIKGN